MTSFINSTITGAKQHSWEGGDAREKVLSFAYNHRSQTTQLGRGMGGGDNVREKVLSIYYTSNMQSLCIHVGLCQNRHSFVIKTRYSSNYEVGHSDGVCLEFLASTASLIQTDCSNGAFTTNGK